MLSLQDASSDADGQVRAWQWTLGDGTSSTLQNPVHTYASAGKYTVSLSVTDDRGAKSAVFSREVTVLSGTPSDTVLLQSSAGGTKMDVKSGQLGAQSFKYGSTGSYVVNKLVIYVSRDSVAPNSALQVSIGSSLNGGTVTNGSVSIPASALTDTSAGAHFQRLEIPFSQGVSLSAGRTYYINLSTNASNGKAYYLELSSGSTAYLGGSYFKNKSDEKKDLRFSLIGH